MATLKISDFSVGDWIGIDQAELNIPSDDLATAYIEKLRKPIRIKGISEDSDMVLAGIETIDGWGSIMLNCEYLKPIPITAEVLEENGWLPPRAEVAGDSWWWTNKEDTAIEASEYQGEWRLTVNEQKEIQYNYRLGLGLKYVHQLQHALRLAGVEKEINL